MIQSESDTSQPKNIDLKKKSTAMSKNVNLMDDEVSRVGAPLVI